MSTQGDVQPEQTYAEQYASVLEQLNKKMESIAEAFFISPSQISLILSVRDG